MNIRRLIRGRRRSIIAVAASGVVGVAAAVTIFLAGGPDQVPPPAAHPAQAPSVLYQPTQQAAPSQTPAAVPAPPPVRNLAAAAPMNRSLPVHISIPAIKVNSGMQSFGLNPDRTVAVPKDGAPGYDLPGWYQYSPTPGQQGPAVVLGHVDSAANGPSVFYHLDDLKPADTVTIRRADNSVATFSVDRVAQVPKTGFPTAQVYGNTPDAALRLITCGGSFDRAAGSYRSNIIVFAHLVV